VCNIAAGPSAMPVKHGTTQMLLILLAAIARWIAAFDSCYQYTEPTQPCWVESLSCHIPLVLVMNSSLVRFLTQTVLTSQELVALIGIVWWWWWWWWR
jgi:hypothetical protein